MQTPFTFALVNFFCVILRINLHLEQPLCYCCMPRVLVIFKELHYLASAFAFAITAIIYRPSPLCTVDNLGPILEPYT